MQALVYNIEIVKAVSDSNGERQEGIEYCDGWNDHANMGIAVICAYDYATGRYRVFTESNRDEFCALAHGVRLMVGFNNVRFDNKVIGPTWGCKIDQQDCFDILAELWKADGLDPDNFVFQTHGGFGLDQCAFVNFGARNTGHGATAPVRWQQGKIGDVIDYCMEDVRLTKMLFDRICEQGFLIHPKDRTRVLSLSAPKQGE